LCSVLTNEQQQKNEKQQQNAVRVHVGKGNYEFEKAIKHLSSRKTRASWGKRMVTRISIP
jgi:hypothetical protein